MVKLMKGLAAVVVIAVGGFFGFEFYTQHRITVEVEPAFEPIRATGAKASRGAGKMRQDCRAPQAGRCGRLAWAL
jgi:predicted negative regulator of RcsB-dependent stress response